MTYSTHYPTSWTKSPSELILFGLPVDLTVDDSFFAEEFVTIVQPEELGLLWPVQLTIQRDEGWFVISDDFSDVYGEGESQEAAVRAYRSALLSLERVLSDREDTLDAELRQRLGLLRSFIPPQG